MPALTALMALHIYNTVVILACDGFRTRRGKAMGRGITDRGVMPRRVSDTGDVHAVNRCARSVRYLTVVLFIYLNHANTENIEQ